MSENTIERYRVLHVDDNVQFLKLFSVMFRRFFEITSACDAEQALEILGSDSNFHAVISDYDLPGLSGIELLKRVKSVNSDLPVIFFTGQGNEEVARNAFLLGVSDYITKEIGGLAQVEKIVNSVNRAVESNRMKYVKDEALQEVKRHKDNLEEVVKERSKEIVELNRKLEAEIEERKKIEAELVSKNRTLENIFEKNPYPMMIVDKEGHISRWNDALLENAIVAPPPDYTFFEDPVHLANGYGPYMEDMRQGNSVVFPESYYNLNDLNPDYPSKSQYKKSIGFPIFDQNGEIECYFFMQEDLTERRLAEQALEKANAELRLMNEELEIKIKTRIAGIEESNEAFRQEIEMRKQAEKDLHRQKSWLSATLAGIGDGVIATDIAGNVVFLNPEAEKLTGWTSGEAYGIPIRTVFEIVNELTEKEAQNPAIKALKTGEKSLLANHTILISKDGTRYPIDDCAAPIMDENGRIAGAVLVFRDITRDRAAREELVAKNKELEDFAYVVSHDLKTPLFTIYGFIEMIEKDPSNYGEFFPIIKGEVTKMEAFISNMLKLCSTGKFINEKRLEIIETGKLLKSLFGFVKPAGEKASLVIKDGIPNLYGDIQRIEEAFMNIFVNAMKNKNPENPDVVITVEGKRNDGRAVISVKDNGKGIKPETIGKIFQPGFTATEGGTGFGLPIVKKIVEAHGGKISAHSEGQGKGAVFTLDMPAHQE
ncbi:MAG: PAS domain S-box protein [Firmicutes bacterium]|nr:PAS domain S-box protein [Bacillota bacterium]